jgi:hypothetical protein
MQNGAKRALRECKMQHGAKRVWLVAYACPFMLAGAQHYAMVRHARAIALAGTGKLPEEIRRSACRRYFLIKITGGIHVFTQKLVRQIYKKKSRGNFFFW